MKTIRDCIYCDEKNKSKHFICECCSTGMCDNCYDLDTEHLNHYNKILDNFNCKETRKIIINICNGIEPEYLCEICLKKIHMKGS